MQVDLRTQKFLTNSRLPSPWVAKAVLTHPRGTCTRRNFSRQNGRHGDGHDSNKWMTVRHKRPDEETAHSGSIGLVGLFGLNKGQICKTRVKFIGIWILNPLKPVAASEILSHAVLFWVFVRQLGGSALSGRGYNYSVCLPSLLSGTSLERPERNVFWRRTRGSVCGESCQGLKKRETELRCERLEFFSSRSEQTTCGVPARRRPWQQLTEVHRCTSAACGRRASPNRRQHMYTRWEEPWKINTFRFFCCFVAQVRQRLKADNYKAGRISQLLKATRPNPERQTTTEVMDSGMGVTGLPRLFGKQAPAGGWEGVAVPPWVQRALVASTAETPVRKTVVLLWVTVGLKATQFFQEWPCCRCCCCWPNVLQHLLRPNSTLKKISLYYAWK